MKLLILVVLLAACNTGFTNEKEPVTIEQVTSTPSQTVFNFMIWYKANHDKITSLVLVNTDTPRAYSVNFTGTEKYLEMFEESGFVSEKYLRYWREYFKKCEEVFIGEPQYDDPPNGFDYDYVMGGQEYEDDLKNIHKSKLSETIHQSKSAVILTMPSGSRKKFSLSLIEDKWLVDGIQIIEPVSR